MYFRLYFRCFPISGWFFCWFASIATAGPGFFKVAEPRIPKAVQGAAKGTYRFIIQAPTPFAMAAAKDVSTIKELLRQKDESLYAQLQLNDCAARLFIADMERRKEEGDFPFHALGTGTAFFIDDHTIITNRHNFHSFNAMPKAYSTARTGADVDESLKNWKPRFILINAADEVAFDSALPGNSISEVLFDGHPLRAAKLEGIGSSLEISTASELLDFVVISLKGIRGKVRVLKPATKAPKVGDPIYAIGYPLRTNGRQTEFHEPDSDGDSIRVSIGNHIGGPDAAYEKFLKSLMPDEEMREYYQERMLFGDIDFASGNSGGPIVNAKGQVVGIATTLRHDFRISPQDAYTLTMSMGTRMSFIRSMIP